MKKDAILEKVAQQNNTTAEEVRNEIIQAIRTAMSAPDPDIQKRWSSVPAAGEQPTPEELIDYIVSKVLQNSV